MRDVVQPEQEHDAFLEAGVASVAAPNYLGDVQTIEFLLRELARKALERRNPPEDPAIPTSLDRQDALNLAAIFLGQVDGYSPMPGWNAPGKVDRFVAQELNVQDDTPQETLACAFARFLTDIYDLYNYACEPETKAEQWEPQVDAICEQYRNLLLGVKEPVATEADILARQDD